MSLEELKHRELKKKDEEIERLRSALGKARDTFEMIKKHNEIVAGNAVHYSMNYRLAKEAFLAIKEALK